MIIVCITGASGAILGIRLIEELLQCNKEVTCIVSQSAWQVINYELQTDAKTIKAILKNRNVQNNLLENLKEYSPDDFFAPVASGSFPFDAAVVIPASMKTVAAIAHGYADNLIHRVCDIALKEKRTLIVVPRETPMSAIHLHNLYMIALNGTSVVMPLPAFYNFPKTIDDVINFVVGRVLDLLHIEHTLYKRWNNENNNR
ncbi:MAG: UbiX family flavin prenyltransferase [Spirochaetota bacterium]|nr:UbiX family flavin prenyltransferase [Spirochaetota bacterium]